MQIVKADDGHLVGVLFPWIEEDMKRIPKIVETKKLDYWYGEEKDYSDAMNEFKKNESINYSYMPNFTYSKTRHAINEVLIGFLIEPKEILSGIMQDIEDE